MEWRHTVWPEVKMVYTAIPKVANTSVKSALLATFRPDTSRRNPHDGNMPYVEARPRTIRRDFADYLHVAVVRDPFDRFVSFYEDRVAGTGFGDRMRRLGFDPSMSFAEAARLASTIGDRRADPHMRSQSYVLTDGAGRLRPHLLLRFERLDHDWQLLSTILAARTGKGLGPLPHRRVSRRRDCSSYYDDEEARALVACRYRTDLELLGYPTSLTPPTVPDHDPMAERLEKALADGAGGVLDLTGALRSRAEAVASHGGHYLGLAYGSTVGQLCHTRVLGDGLVPTSAFDVLLVTAAAVRRFRRHRRLRAGFASPGRTVLTA